MNPINQIIAEGKRLCEGAIGVTNDLVNRQVPIEEAGEPEEYEKFLVYHNPYKMKHLYETLEKAVKLAEHFKDHGHFEYNEEGQEVDVYPAREFLALIEKRGG